MKPNQTKNIFYFLLIIAIQLLFFIKNKWFMIIFGGYTDGRSADNVRDVIKKDVGMNDFLNEDTMPIFIVLIACCVLLDLFLLYKLIKGKELFDNDKKN